MLSFLPTVAPPFLLHTSPLLFLFSSTHYHYIFPCPPPTISPAPFLLYLLPFPLPITSSTVVLPSLLPLPFPLHFSSPPPLCLHFTSHRHASLFPFPSPQDQRSPLSSITSFTVAPPSSLPPLFSLELPSPLPFYLHLTSHRHVPRLSLSPSSKTRGCPYPPPTAIPPPLPYYLLHCCSPLSSPTIVPPAPPISTIATSPTFPFPLPPRPEVAPFLHLPPVSLPFSLHSLPLPFLITSSTVAPPLLSHRCCPSRPLFPCCCYLSLSSHHCCPLIVSSPRHLFFLLFLFWNQVEREGGGRRDV